MKKYKKLIVILLIILLTISPIVSFANDNYDEYSSNINIDFYEEELEENEYENIVIITRCFTSILWFIVLLLSTIGTIFLLSQWKLRYYYNL